MVGIVSMRAGMRIMRGGGVDERFAAVYNKSKQIRRTGAGKDDSMISKLTDIVGRPDVGEGTVIEDYVAIGKNVLIGHHVVIHTGTIIGDDVRIDDFTCIGKPPLHAPVRRVKGKNGKWKHGMDTMQASTDDPNQRCIIGARTVIGTGAVIYQGAHIDTGCTIGDNVNLREGVHIGERASVGSNAYIAAHAEVGAGERVAVGAVISKKETPGAKEPGQN